MKFASIFALASSLVFAAPHHHPVTPVNDHPFDRNPDVFNYGYGHYPYAENSCQHHAQRRYTARVVEVQRAYQRGLADQVGSSGSGSTANAAWQNTKAQRMNDELIRLQAE